MVDEVQTTNQGNVKKWLCATKLLCGQSWYMQ